MPRRPSGAFLLGPSADRSDFHVGMSVTVGEERVDEGVPGFPVGQLDVDHPFLLPELGHVQPVGLLVELEISDLPLGPKPQRHGEDHFRIHGPIFPGPSLPRKPSQAEQRRTLFSHHLRDQRQSRLGRRAFRSSSVV